MKALVILAVILMLGLSFSALSVHETPTVSKGECFQYREILTVSNGKGNYSGYSCNIYINGTEVVTGLSNNSSVDMKYNYSCVIISPSEKYTYPQRAHGVFNFSSNTCDYINGTDNETGDNGTHVWFYVNPNIEVGNRTSLLGTSMKVRSNQYNYTPPNHKYIIDTVYLSGIGTCNRNDSLGNFNANYTWNAYFDHSSGFIAAYTYKQTDLNAQGDGFTCTETLYVSHSSYGVNISEVTPVSEKAPAPFPYTDLFLIIAFIFVVIIVVAIAVSRGKKNKLNQHSSVSSGVNMKHEHSDNENEIKPEPEQKETEQVVIKEIVKVKCQYCGALIDSTVDKCPFCGAPRS